MSVYWKGADGNVWTKGEGGVVNRGKYLSGTADSYRASGPGGLDTYGTGLRLIDDPNPPQSQQAAPTGGNYDPAAAQRAQEAAQAAALRAGVQGTIGSLQGIYDQLFGDVQKAATSQRQQLDKRFNREVEGLTNQFNEELPAIGQAWAGRGAYDSSYRINSEEGAKTGFQNQIQDIGLQREADAAKIGQFVSENQAKFNAEKNMLKTIMGRLGELTDINELTQLRNQIDRQMADVQAQRGGVMSQEAFMKKAQGLAPAADRMGSLMSTLSSIIQGQAPGPLKRAVAEQIIGSAGLQEDEANQLRNQVISQIG